MRKIVGLSMPFFLIISGIAVAACVTLAFPFPPVPVKISFLKIASASSKGYPNPVNAAAMSTIDDIGIKAAGFDLWKATNYTGYFTYSTPAGGANTMYIDKPCDAMAIDSTPGGALADIGPGGSGGSGGGSGGGTCSGVTTGIVGYQEETQNVQVCTDGVCSTQTVVVGLMPIYGSVSSTC